MKTDLSIVVRARNEAKYLSYFIQSLDKQEGNFNIERILIDTESVDETVELAKSNNFKIYSIKKMDFDYGLSCDLGMKLSCSNFICFASAHVELLDCSILKEAIELLRGDSNIAAIYFRQIPNERMGSNIFENTFLHYRFPPINMCIKNNMAHSFSNAFSIINKRAWENEKFGSKAGSEDKIWADNVLKKKYHIFYYGEKCIAHSHNENLKETEKRIYINLTEQLKNTNKVAYPIVGLLKVLAAMIIFNKKITLNMFKYALAYHRGLKKAWKSLKKLR